MYNDKLQKAKYKLLRDYKYFYILLGKFNTIIKDCEVECQAYVEFGKNGELSKNRINLNKEFLERDDYEYSHLVYTITHEIMHIILQHGKRLNNRIFELWHIAVNHVVDRECRKIFKNDIFPYELGYGIIDELHNELPECSSEEAYEWLQVNADDKLTISINDSMTQIYVTDKNGKSWNVTPTEFKDKDMDNFKASSIVSYEAMKEMGHIPGNLSDVLDGFMKIETPWDDLVKKSIKTNAIKVSGGRSWRKLNPFYRSHGLTLPSKKKIDKKDKTGHLYVAIDTSISMSKEDLAKLGYIIYESGIYYSKVTVFAHDTIVHDKFEFEHPEQFKKYIEEEGYKGRGGTSHIDVFNHMEKDAKDDVDLLSLIICLTDGYSDAHVIYKDYWFTKNFPMMMLISGNWTYNFEYNNIGVINIER